MIRTLAGLLYLCLPVLADEIQTKDGKKFEFETLIDKGDSWELITPQGAKVTIQKADFDKFIPSGAKEVPLTGASFTFDRKKVKLENIDLFSKVDLKKDVVSGTWRFAGGALSGTGIRNAHARINTSYTPPEEYDLSMVVERREAGGEQPGMHVIVVAGGRRVDFSLETAGAMNGVNGFNGKNVIDGGIGLQGATFFPKGEKKVLLFMVRKEALIVQLDGKDWYVWKAEWNKIPVEGNAVNPGKAVMGFGVDITTWAIHKAVVTAPKDKN